MAMFMDIPSEEAFKSTLESTPPSTLVVLSFHAPWAAPCAQMRTILETLASTYPPPGNNLPATVTFLSVNAEELPDISESYDVTAVPYLVLLRDGKTVETVSGCDATKVRNAVEKNANTDNKKVAIPPMLPVTPRPIDPSNEVSPATNGQTIPPPPANSAPAKDPSSYAPKLTDAHVAPASSSTSTSKEELHTRLSSLVNAAPVMLFMKGTPSVPQCGFSRKLVGILRENSVRYGFFNVLADDEVRQGLKEFADWPTFPQLWLNGELVGGLDIVRDELEADPEYLKPYSVSKPNGGPAAQNEQGQSATATA